MSGNGFRLSMAEFKGKVIASLKNIERALDNNTDQHKSLFERTERNRREIIRLKERQSVSTNPFGWLRYLFRLMR